MSEYLNTPIVEAKRTPEIPRYGVTVDGYTHRSGAPTSVMIRLQGEKRWRRLMVICFSNAGSVFIKSKGARYFVHEYDIPTIPNDPTL